MPYKKHACPTVLGAFAYDQILPKLKAELDVLIEKKGVGATVGDAKE